MAAPSGRQFRFEVLPAEFISQIEVVKTPTADMAEGALGGNIDVHTFRRSRWAPRPRSICAAPTRRDRQGRSRSAPH